MHVSFRSLSFEKTLQKTREKRIVALFGEVLVDAFPDRNVLGGAPFNVARHLRAFGLDPLLITRTGNDEIRDELLETMTGFGMDIRGVQNDMTRESGKVVVHIDGNDHSFDILPECAYDHIHAGIVHMIALAVRPEMIYFGTLAQRSEASRRALTALLSSSRAPRLLDINLRKPWYELSTIKRSLKRADIVKMNEEELALVSSMLRLSGKTPEEHAAALVLQFNLERILVTCGEKGAWQLGRGGRKMQAAGRRSGKFVDSVGAGDGFAAVLITGALQEWADDLTLARATDFAAAICTIRGAIPYDEDFYAPFLEEWTGPRQSCIS